MTALSKESLQAAIHEAGLSDLASEVAANTAMRLLAEAVRLPGDDPFLTLVQWLNGLSSCDPKCTKNHPFPHSVAEALRSATVIARTALDDVRRERDDRTENLLDAIEVIAALRLDRSSYTDAALNARMAALDPGVGL